MSMRTTLLWTIAAVLALFWLGAYAASAQDAKVFLLTPEESKAAQDAYKAAKEAAKHYTDLKAKLKEKYEFDFEILFSDDFKAIVPSDSQTPWYRGLGPCVMPPGLQGFFSPENSRTLVEVRSPANSNVLAIPPELLNSTGTTATSTFTVQHH